MQYLSFFGPSVIVLFERYPCASPAVTTQACIGFKLFIRVSHPPAFVAAHSTSERLRGRDDFQVVIVEGGVSSYS